MDQKRSEVEEARAANAQLSFDLDNAHVDKAKATLQHHAAIVAIRTAQDVLLEAQIREIEARSDVQGLKARNTELVQMLEEEKHNIASFSEESQRARRRAEEAQSKVIEIFARDETRKDLLESLAKDRTVEDIDNDIVAKQGSIELIQVANPGALREFEKRAREIEKLRSKMESSTAKLDHLNRQITKIREKWEPKLDELVGKISDAFSYNFEQINCAGEIRIHKDEDFDQWALDIMVKFRYGSHPQCSMLCLLESSNNRAEKTRRSSSSTSIANPAASELFPPSFISWLSSPWRNHPSVWSMRSTRAWIPATSAWCMSAW